MSHDLGVVNDVRRQIPGEYIFTVLIKILRFEND